MRFRSDRYTLRVLEREQTIEFADISSYTNAEPGDTVTQTVDGTTATGTIVSKYLDKLVIKLDTNNNIIANNELTYSGSRTVNNVVTTSTFTGVVDTVTPCPFNFNEIVTMGAVIDDFDNNYLNTYFPSVAREETNTVAKFTRLYGVSKFNATIRLVEFGRVGAGGDNIVYDEKLFIRSDKPHNLEVGDQVELN